MIRILLVDDQTILRQALSALLEKESDFQIVGSVNNGQAAIEQVELLKPDVVLLDVEMPEMDGVTATRLICERFPGTKILVLSGYDSDAYLASALQAGAKGYLLKDTASVELASAIRSIHRGHSQMGPGLFEKLLSKVSTPAVSSGNTNSKTVSAVAEPALPTPNLLLLLKNFEPDALLEVVHRAEAQQVTADLFARMSNYLKRDPSSLAALYLTGALAHRAQDKVLAFQYLKFGFKEAVKRQLPREQLLLFYQEGALLKPQEAFSWLTQTELWGTPEGVFFLLEESRQLFGIDSMQFQTLRSLQRIRAMQAWGDDCVSLSLRLEGLQQGFDRIGKLLKL